MFDHLFLNPSLWSFASTLFLAVLAILQRHYAEAQAREVREVKDTLKATTDSTNTKMKVLQETADKVHVLVNNAMSVALKDNAILARKIANMTGSTDDKNAATLAEAASEYHEAQQKKLDAMET